MNNHAIVVGIKGYLLSSNEIDYFKNFKPIGVILFKRNISSKKQVMSLVKEIKKYLGSKVLIMIDQEGGKVSRLNKKNWPNFPSANYFGKIAIENIEKAKKLVFKNYNTIGKELNTLGINYNCAPVLDLLIKNSSKIIGSRSFSRDPKLISILADQACKGLVKAKVHPIIKHIPGHGRAKEDSHVKLPVINLSEKQLKEDFYPFKKLKGNKAAMTAHIRFNKLDSKNCVTHSKFIINEVIRKKIGFKGVLFSDDLCMKALKGSYFSRAKKAIESGCDIVLHCEPNIKYIMKSTKGSGKVSTKLRRKLQNN